MRIALIGAGNMGCVYGAHTARVGEEVTMVDTWTEHLEVMRDRGLAMEGQNGTFTVSADAATDVGDVFVFECASL